MIPQKRDLKSRRGQVLTEQAFVLAAIVAIVLVAISRMGFETSSVFDQLSKTFPRMSRSGLGKEPAAKRGKRGPSRPTEMAAATATPGAASATAGSKAPGKKAGRARRGSGGGGISQAKRNRGVKRSGSGSVSWGVTSTSSSSGSLAVLIGGR